MAKFYFEEHQHKARAYVEALEKGGHWRTFRKIGAEFLFVGHDIGPKGVGHKPGLDFAHNNGVPVFIYPHSARPNVMADTHDPWPHTRALFTISQGHKEVLQILGYPCPVEVCGWTYSEIRPFKSKVPGKKIKVLFAPIHPNANGYLNYEDQELNRRVYNLLVNMPEVDLTVRHIKSLESNGIIRDYRGDKAKLVEGKPDGTTKEIEAADVVIGSYTLAHITVALGKPLVMMAEQMRPHVGNTEGLIFYSKNWEKYRELMRYPFEIEDVLFSYDDALEMLTAAMSRSKAVSDWKRRFIGKPFDGGRFVEKVNSYL